MARRWFAENDVPDVGWIHWTKVIVGGWHREANGDGGRVMRPGTCDVEIREKRGRESFLILRSRGRVLA